MGSSEREKTDQYDTERGGGCRGSSTGSAADGCACRGKGGQQSRRIGRTGGANALV